MNWEVFYLVCFFLGFALSLVSFVAGGLHLHLPTKFHFHIGHGHFGSGGHAATGVSIFNTFSLMVFLAWFGGVGYLLTRHQSIGAWFAFGLAVMTGMMGAMIVFLFMAKVLMPHDRAINQADYEMVGVLGRVSSSIRERGTGEMVFTLEGTRRSCGARAENGSALPRGTEVVVTRYQNGIAYVRTWDELSGDAEAPAGSRDGIREDKKS